MVSGAKFTRHVQRFLNDRCKKSWKTCAMNEKSESIKEGVFEDPNKLISNIIAESQHQMNLLLEKVLLFLIQLSMTKALKLNANQI